MCEEAKLNNQDIFGCLFVSIGNFLLQ